MFENSGGGRTIILRKTIGNIYIIHIHILNSQNWNNKERFTAILQIFHRITQHNTFQVIRKALNKERKYIDRNMI